ncbi:hypothetical protein NUACC26_014540 [Scytonema sp. NUACC26]
MGNAADRADILLQPYELLDLYPMLARVVSRARREGVQTTVKLLQQFAIILKEFVTIFLIELHKSVMEGINNRIKLIKRQAYGFVNF